MQWQLAFLQNTSGVELENTYNTMSASKKARVDRLKLKEDKQRSLLAELLAKNLLKENGVSYTAIEADENGKPYLSGSNWFISLSHSGSAAACVIGETPVGIDIQKIKPVKAVLIKRVCNPAEQDYVLGGQTPETLVENPQILTRFYEIWTTKEALFKKENSKTPFTKLNALSVEHKTEKIKDFIVTIV